MYFFDLDGTLLDSNGIWLDIDIDFLGQQGISPVPEDYTEYVTHHTFGEAAEYTRRRFSLPISSQEIVTIWHNMAQDAYANTLPLKEGALDFLQRANCAGIRCALLTSCMPSLCEAALRRHGLVPFFQRVLTTAELGADKRDPELFRRAAAISKEPPERCVLFDDSPVYCAAAKQAGWQVYGVADPIFEDRREEMAALCGPGRYPFSFCQEIPD